MSTLAISHIESTPGIAGGKPRIAGRRITVGNIALWHVVHEMDLNTIASEHNLSLAEIHAALSCFFDHRDEIEQSMKEDNSFTVSLRENTPSKISPSSIRFSREKR